MVGLSTAPTPTADISHGTKVPQVQIPVSKLPFRIGPGPPSALSALTSGRMRHCFQASEARRIAEARRYRHGGRDSRQKRKIIGQLEQVGNCQGESDIAVKRDVLLLAAAHLCTPLARQCVLIKDHGETSAISTDLGFAPMALRESLRSVSVKAISPC